MSNELLLASVYRRAAVSFLVLTIALLLLVAYVVLPTALVVVTPSIEDFENNYFFTVTPDAVGDDEVHGARFTTEIVLEQTFPASGEDEVLEELTGTVTLVNDYSKSQSLIRTTRLITEDGVLLRLDEGVTISPGEQVEVPVYLDDDTVTTATLPPGRLTIPGLWEGIQDRIYGEIISPLIGTTRVTNIVMTDDVTEAQKALRQRAESQARDELLRVFKSSQAIPANATEQWELSLVSLVDESWDLPDDIAGAKQESFTVAGTFTYEGVFYDTAEAEAKVGALYAREPDTFNATIMNSEVRKTETELELPDTEVMVSVNGKQKYLEKDGFLEEHPIDGLTVEQAIRQLLLVDGVEDVKIELSPFWVTKVPKGKIDLVIISN